jgi:hypothetical protein
LSKNFYSAQLEGTLLYIKKSKRKPEEKKADDKLEKTNDSNHVKAKHGIN